MKKKLFYVLLALAAVSAFSGCGNKDSESDSSETAEDPVTISYGLWGTEQRKNYTLEQIEAFEEKYPYITVELDFASWDDLDEEIDDIMATGRESDVMQINYDWLSKYSPDGEGFYDLNELSDFIRLDSYSDFSIGYGMVNGKLNAVPVAFNTTVPVFNKTMYDYYGLAIPESVDDLYDAAKVMKQDNVYQLGLEDKHIVMFLFGCYYADYGESFIDVNGNLLLSESCCTYLAVTYKKLLDRGVLCPRNKFEETYIEGNRVAGVICWLNSIEKYKKIMENAGDEPTVGKFLWTDTSEPLGNFVKPSLMLAISKSTEHPKEAAMLLDYLSNDETAITLQGVEKGVPDSRYAQEALMKAGSLNNDIFYTTLRLNFYMEYLQTLPGAIEDSNVIDSILFALDGYYYGSLNLDETITALKGIR